MSIKSIRLRNFRQFQDFKIYCRAANILVGPNNAGKSTCLDALRFLVDVMRFSRSNRPNNANNSDGLVCATYSIGQEFCGPPITNANRNYNEEDAQIDIEHNNGNSIQILLHPERAVRAHLITDGAPPRTAVGFRSSFPVDIILVPTLGPLEENETYVTDATVVRNRNTRLASRSFRNILMRMDGEEFEAFSQLVRESWPKIELERPRITDYKSKNLEMRYTESRIPREVYWAGIGFQVWMQIMLQFMRGSENSILVLDEPDIYLHPDAQKTLTKIVQKKFIQYFIATHSSEIVNEAEPGDILLITREKNTAQRISNEDGYRELFNYLGSSENAEFARIARARRIVFFEGKDRKIIGRIASKVENTEMIESPDTAYFQAGGFSQWTRIQNVDWALENMFKIEAKIASIFDRDFRCDEEIKEFLAKMNTERMSCHVLDRKEIENYAIELEPLKRLVIKRTKGRDFELTPNEAETLILDVCESLREDAQAQMTASYLTFHKSRNPAIDSSTYLKSANTLFNENWQHFDGIKHVIPGKLFFSELSKKLQQEYGVGITIAQVIGEMKKNDISESIISIFREIDLFFSS